MGAWADLSAKHAGEIRAGAGNNAQASHAADAGKPPSWRALLKNAPPIYRAKTGFRASAALAFFSGAGLALPAAAQNSNLLPTREQYEQPSPPPSLNRREQIVSADDAIEGAPCPLANPEFSHIQFTLRDVQFSGADFFDQAALARSWAHLQGQNLSLASVCEIRDRAATLLRQHGYLAAVQVPAQTISDGIIRLDIKSARLSRIEVRGDAGANAKLLQRYLAHLQDQPVFNLIDAERYLLLAREIPGMDTRLTLRPSMIAGEVIGEVQVARMPYMFDFGVQNFGSKDVGRWSAVARAQIAGVTGQGDLTTISFYATPDLEEQKVAQIAHEFRIGSEGLRLGGSYSYAWTRPDIGNIDLRSQAQIISLSASFPAILAQSRRLTLGGGLDIIDQDVALARLPINRDRLRVLHLRADAAWIDPASITGRTGFSRAEPRWSLQTSLEARQGLSALGASRNCAAPAANCRILPSRIEGRADAFVLRGTVAGEFRPQAKLALAGQVRGQWANEALLSYEEFSGGNFTIGRGYDAGTVIGDHGIAASAELRYAASLRLGDKHIALHPFAFFDAAKVWNEDQIFSGVNGQSLASAGAGLRSNLPPIGRLEFSLAVPLKRAGLAMERPDPRLLLSYSTYFGVRSR